MRVDSAWTPGQPVWRGEIDGRPAAAQVRPILNGFEIAHGGAQVAARVYTLREAEFAGADDRAQGRRQFARAAVPDAGAGQERSRCKEGQEVKAGEPLCMVEAMKMENVLLAERDVTVKKILAKPGDSLAVDAVIMEFA